MKYKIHIPTIQFGFIEAESDNVEELIGLHNKYCIEKIVEREVPHQYDPTENQQKIANLKEYTKSLKK